MALYQVRADYGSSSTSITSPKLVWALLETTCPTNQSVCTITYIGNLSYILTHNSLMNAVCKSSYHICVKTFIIIHFDVYSCCVPVPQPLLWSNAFLLALVGTVKYHCALPIQSNALFTYSAWDSGGFDTVVCLPVYSSVYVFDCSCTVNLYTACIRIIRTWYLFIY